MKRESDDTAVEDSIAEITKAEDTGKADVIPDARDERLGDHRPFKTRLAGFFTSGLGRTIIGLALILGVALAVPMTRYTLLGVFIKKQTVVTVVDDLSGKPVSEAVVHFGRLDAKTDSKGVARLDGVSVGDHPLSVEKKYYTTIESSYTVPIFGEAKTTIRLKATGRVATVTVKDKISGNPLAGAQVKVSDTSAITDDKGTATIALAIRDADQPGMVTAQGYNDVEIAISTKDTNPSQEVALVPNGKTYFISNRTGKYDVMSTTLDGQTDVVLSGTGSEFAYELGLLASPDRSYLAYNAGREGNKTALYLINTATKELTKVEDSSVGLIGWIDNTFYYSVYNVSGLQNVDKRIQLIAYNANSKQRTVVDASKLELDGANNPIEQSLSGRFQLVGSRVYYAKCWNYQPYYGGDKNRKASLMSVNGTNVTSIKDVPQADSAYCDTIATKPNVIYFRLSYSNGDSEAYRYQPGKTAESVQVSDGELYNSQVTYLASPDGKKTFWTEVRDGKKVSFIGNSDGANAEQVSGADYEAYGWFGENYVLYSKNGSELYVAAQGAELDGAHKIADFYTQPRGPGGY